MIAIGCLTQFLWVMWGGAGTSPTLIYFVVISLNNILVKVSVTCEYNLLIDKTPNMCHPPPPLGFCPYLGGGV